MDNSTKRRLVLGFLSNLVSRLAGTIIQLIQVPVFLHFWSVSLYGEWMIVTAIPSYLSISNMGFGNVAGNEMTMMTARGDRESALRVFQSCWWLISIVCAAVMVLLGVALYFLPVARWLKLQEMGAGDAKWVIFYLGCSVLLNQLEALLQSAYRCVGRYSYGSFVKSMYSLAAFAVMLIPVCLGGGARMTALVLAVANGFFTFVLCIMVRRDIPWIHYGWSHASVSEIRRLTAPAFAFMAFPIGNALNLQGTLMAVGYALGPVAVVIFGTARTVSRVALQMMSMVNNTFWPEMSSAFGMNDIPLLRTLHRRACQLALIISLGVVAAMMTIGPWFLTHWTSGHVPPSRGLLSLLLLVVVIYSLWATSSTVVAAINQHQKLAASYIFATSLTVVVTYFSAKYSGLIAAAASLLLSELIMNVYVLPNSLRITHDTFGAFMASMLLYPNSLRPAALLARLKRSKPQLENPASRFSSEPSNLGYNQTKELTRIHGRIQPQLPAAIEPTNLCPSKLHSHSRRLARHRHPLRHALPRQHPSPRPPQHVMALRTWSIRRRHLLCHQRPSHLLASPHRRGIPGLHLATKLLHPTRISHPAAGNCLSCHPPHSESRDPSSSSAA